MNLKILNLTKQQESNIKLILSNQLDPKEFSSVQFWIGQCYNLPSLDEQKMCAFNHILFGFGIESVEGEWQNGYWCNILLTYVSMGFSDLPTIIHHRDKGFIVDSIENIITKSNRRARCQNKSPRASKMTSYSNDPRQITAKFSSNCSKCKTKIKKEATIYYWPSSHEVFCTSCGDAPYRQFLSSAADEDAYNGTGNPYAR